MMEIEALGKFSIAWEGGPSEILAVTTPVKLLALLVASDEFTRTENELVECLWPHQQGEEQGAVNLGNALKKLRDLIFAGAPHNAPHPAILVARERGYLRLSAEHVRVDAFAIEHHATALLDDPAGLLRARCAENLIARLASPFLQGLPQGLREERAVVAVRTRLTVLRRKLLTKTCEALRAAGGDRAAELELIEAAFSATPGDEEIAHRYISLLTLERRPKDAWRAYDLHTIGTTPTPRLSRLMANFHEPIAAFSNRTTADPILGRDDVLATIDQALAVGGRIAIVAAEGRGRTRLLLESVWRARASGAIVGVARGQFGLAGDRVVRDLHRSLLVAIEKSGNNGPRIQIRASGESFPGDTYAALIELERTLDRLRHSNQRVVLALDDPHFVNHESLREIETTIKGFGVTFVSTARANLDSLPREARFIEVLDLDVTNEGRLVEIRLGRPFEQKSLARLRALWPGNLTLLISAADHASDNRISEIGDGNGLRIRDNVSMASLLPESISDYLRSRFQPLHHRAGVIGAALATGPRPLTADELVTITGYEPSKVQEYLKTLVRAGLVLLAPDSRLTMPLAIALVASRLVSSERLVEFNRRIAAMDPNSAHSWL